MNWLLQNGVWVLAATAFAAFVIRYGSIGRALASRAGTRQDPYGGALNSMGHQHGGFLGGILGDMGHGGHGGHDEGSSDEVGPGNRAANLPEAAIDPVAGEPVSTARALTSVYQDKIYFFTSKENRDRFEAAPQAYADKASGYPLQAPVVSYDRRERRRGC